MEIQLPEIHDGEDKSSPFINCIRKNYKHVKKWAKRTNTNCFRIYDREIHHYPFAIDYYDGNFCIHFFASKNNPELRDEQAQEIILSLQKIFNISEKSIYWRIRSKAKETRQYEKQANSKDFFTVLEYGVKFKVNLKDYLDTGLFLDHRETRKYVSSIAKDKKILNLFAYTCSFSVHAAVAGATFTKSVDMSNTYTSWGKDNFLLNKLSLHNNEIVRADCLKFLEEEVLFGVRYDIIVIDPPTISRSKKMDQLFDIHYDYIYLINQAIRLLNQNGTIIFSTNSRKFLFDYNLFPNCTIRDVSDKTIPIDFHDPKIHRCWNIQLKKS
ncbi:MAG: SAM-dependent methyltransferase [Chlamydia sp. 32-24]|nr:MAG: SAM-dependent methyltransferase [Chlamydia sp. 32-24]